MTAPDASKVPTGLRLYTSAAEAACNTVIAAYSTSFGWATKLLSAPMRQPIRNIYAMVRVADEIVDGAAAQAAEAGGTVDPASALDLFERETYESIDAGFSTNLVSHAFAKTAREYGIGRELITPFFDSMRADLTESEHDQASFERYIYGSAEVVGLMCLKVFIAVGGHRYTAEEVAGLERGACALGSAFQKVNFLRDIAADFNRLGRSYFPGVSVSNFTDAERDRIVAEIAAEVAEAKAQLRNLPAPARRAVYAALLLFEALNRKISSTPAVELASRRIRVGNGRKILLVLRAMLPVTE